MNSEKKLLSLPELPVKIVINNEVAADLICTPIDIEALVTGWLLSEKYIECLGDVSEIDFDIATSTIHVKANVLKPAERPRISDAVSAALRSDGLEPVFMQKDENIQLFAKISELGKILVDNKQEGKHTSMLYNEGRFVVKSDVSRHSSVDKVIGEGAKINMQPQSSLLVTTGRISTEFLWKAKMQGIKAIASLKYPSKTGMAVAKKWGIDLAERILSDDMQIYLSESSEIKHIISL